MELRPQKKFVNFSQRNSQKKLVEIIIENITNFSQNRKVRIFWGI